MLVSFYLENVDSAEVRVERMRVETARYSLAGVRCDIGCCFANLSDWWRDRPPYSAYVLSAIYTLALSFVQVLFHLFVSIFYSSFFSRSQELKVLGEGSSLTS